MSDFLSQLQQLSLACCWTYLEAQLLPHVHLRHGLCWILSKVMEGLSENQTQNCVYRGQVCDGFNLPCGSNDAHHFPEQNYDWNGKDLDEEDIFMHPDILLQGTNMSVEKEKDFLDSLQNLTWAANDNSSMKNRANCLYYTYNLFFIVLTKMLRFTTL